MTEAFLPLIFKNIPRPIRQRLQALSTINAHFISCYSLVRDPTTQSITIISRVGDGNSATTIFLDERFQQPIPEHPRFRRLCYKISTKRLSKVFIHRCRQIKNDFRQIAAPIDSVFFSLLILFVVGQAHQTVYRRVISAPLTTSQIGLKLACLKCSSASSVCSMKTGITIVPIVLSSLKRIALPTD